jgi:hypothetical protein
VTPHLLLDIVVPAETAHDAEEAAKAWAAAKPDIVLVKLTRVRPGDHVGLWRVEFAYSVVESDQLQAGL